MNTEYQTRAARLEHAVEMLTASGKSLASSSRFVLIDSANVSPLDLADIMALPKIKSSAGTHAAANILSMLRKAFEYINGNKTGTTEIWIVSDLQKSNWEPGNYGWQEIENKFKTLPQAVRFRLLAVDSKADDNAAVRITKAPEHKKNSDGIYELEFEIIRSYPEEINMPVTIAVGENKRQVNFNISGKSAKIKHVIKTGAETPEGIPCRIEIPADSNKSDNTAFFSFCAEPDMNVAIVSSRKSLAAEILNLAATAIVPKTSTIKNYSTENADLIDFDNTSLILWLDDSPDEKIRKNIISFIEDGGIVLFFPPQMGSSGNDFLGSKWGQIETAQTEAGFRVSEWDRKSGPFEDSFSGAALPLDNLKIIARRTILGGNLVPCASYADGKYMFLRAGVGRGAAYFCSTLPDSKWSGLKEGEILIPLLSRLAKSGAAKNSRVVFADCGTWTDTDNTGGKLINSADSGEKTDGNSSGIFKTDGKYIVLNFPISETDFESLNPEEIKTLFKDLPISLFHDKGGKNINIQAEIWKGFLLAMLFFMIAEAFLCLPREIKSKTGKKK
jgi:hypothetical protein